MSKPYTIVRPWIDLDRHNTEVRWCFKNVTSSNWRFGDLTEDNIKHELMIYEFEYEKDAILFALRFG